MTEGRHRHEWPRRIRAHPDILHEAMLDDVHWPTTTALIDEACGLTSNALLVGEGPKDDLRVLFVGLYYRGQRRWNERTSSGSTTGDSAAKTWNERTSRSTIPSTNVCRACGNCPTRGLRPRGARPPRKTAATSQTIWGSAPYLFRYSSHMPLDRATAWNPPVYRPRHECVCR